MGFIFDSGRSTVGGGVERTGGMCMSVSLMRSVLSFLNTFFMMVAIACTGLGVWLHVEQDFGSQLVGIPLSLGVIFISLFLLFVSVIACVGMGGNGQRWCILNVYIMLLLLVICAQGSMAYMALSFRDNLEEQLYQGWLDSSDQLRNSIQNRLDCCWFYGAVDNPGSDCKPSGGSLQHQRHQHQQQRHLRQPQPPSLDLQRQSVSSASGLRRRLESTQSEEGFYDFGKDPGAPAASGD